MPDPLVGDFRVGDHTVRVREGRLLGPAGETRVEPRVMDVLVYLAGRAGEVVLRGELLDALWPGQVGADESLTRCISQLRQALGDERGSPRFLETVPKRGYRLVAEVTRLNDSDGHEAPPADAPAAPPRSIAVLPFANLSDDPRNEYFGDGLAEELLGALSKIDGLRVAARTSAFAFKDRREDAREIAERLNVAVLLEGSVRRAGKRVRVAVQMVNAADGYQLWSERYDRELEDIFAIQEEIAQNIVRALEVTLSPREQRAIQFAGVRDVRAYEYYLRGRTYFHRFDARNLEFASQTFQHALDIDPEFARAWAGLADCEAFAYMYYESSKARAERALDASRRAVELAPDLAEAHASRGLAHMLNADYDEAEAEFERAEHLDPRLFEAWYFHGRACFQRGEIERAAQLFEQAAAVRPEDYQGLLLASSIYSGLGLHDKAGDTARRGIAAAEKQLELNPLDARALYLCAGARLELGDRDAAVACAERARALDPDDSVVLHNIACLYARIGEPEKAMDCLEHGVSRVGGLAAGGAAWYRHDPDLKSLHGHPRFEALLDRTLAAQAKQKGK